MKLSAYGITIGAKQRRYPICASILSTLAVAEELCLGYDPRFDDPQTFTDIDPRVRPIELRYDFLEFDFINNALTQALRHCKGDWCLLQEMDGVLHEKDIPNILHGIDEAERQGAEALYFGMVETCQSYLNPKGFFQGGRLPIIINAPFLYHKTPPEGIGMMESDCWGGKFIKFGFDDFELFDARRNGRLLRDKAYRLAPRQVEPVDTIEKEVEARLSRYSYVWHYSWYNFCRKVEQGQQTAIWQDRTYGRSSDLDVERQIKLLKETIVMRPDVNTYMTEPVRLGWVEVEVQHPVYVQDWIGSMGLDAR